MKPGASSGFTLLELSMVIVIIGLVASGIMVGRDLIKTSTARKAVGQIQEVQTAISTFRNKYDSIPGDMPNAEEYWFDEGAINGDGNGCIEGNPADGVFEVYNFWHHLYMAQLLKGTFVPVTTLPAGDAQGVAYPTALPLGNMHVYCVEPFSGTYSKTNFEERGDHYLTMYPGALSFDLGGYLLNAFAASTAGLNYGIWASDLQFIDSKLDDGLPLTGKIMSAINGIPGNEPGSCPASNGDNVYNTDKKATRPNCAMWFRAPEINVFGTN